MIGQRSIEITIPRSLNAPNKVEAIGFSGGSCKEFTRTIEAALGATEGVDEKPEIHEQEQAPERARA